MKKAILVMNEYLSKPQHTFGGTHYSHMVSVITWAILELWPVYANRLLMVDVKRYNKDNYVI